MMSGLVTGEGHNMAIQLCGAYRPGLL